MNICSDSQQEANKREYLRRARVLQRDVKAGDAIATRIRDNPEDRDIRNGDALNAILAPAHRSQDPQHGAAVYQRSGRQQDDPGDSVRERVGGGDDQPRRVDRRGRLAPGAAGSGSSPPSARLMRRQSTRRSRRTRKGPSPSRPSRASNARGPHCGPSSRRTSRANPVRGRRSGQLHQGPGRHVQDASEARRGQDPRRARQGQGDVAGQPAGLHARL